MSEILVSICCATYNHENYIRDAIEGFLMQKTTFKFEVLIHDDASTDKTQEIIKEYHQVYPGLIKPIYQTENQFSKGINPSIKYNVCRAKGKYIAFCEGDDYWTDPYKLQKQVDFMEANPEYSMCGHTTKVIDVTMNEEINYFYKKYGKNMELPFSFLSEGLFFQSGTMLIRRKYIKNGFPKFFVISPVGDLALQLWMAHLGKVYYFNDEMSIHRKFTPGSWNVTRHRTEIQRIEIANKVINMLNEFNKFSNKKHDDVIRKRIENLKGDIQYLKTTPFYKFSNRVLDLKIPNQIIKLKERENYIFGAGTDGIKLQTYLSKMNIGIKGFIDNNSVLQNNSVNGKPVYSLDIISENANILISPIHWAEEIINQLVQNGYNNYYLIRFDVILQN